MAVNEVTGVKEVIEVTVVDGEKNTDANGGVESIEESLENLHTPTKEQAVMRSELAETFAEKVKKGMSGESTGASVGGKALRPSLPRVSKTNHRGTVAFESLAEEFTILDTTNVATRFDFGILIALLT
ncbi:hypothetical protein YC2023_121546 [Brassica napus]